MKVTRRERRWRDALMLSMIDPGSMTTTALSHAFHTARKPMAAGRLLGRAAASLHPGSDANTQFWSHFEQRAPFHLQLALRGASALIAGVLPRLCGHLRSLDKLDDDARDQVLQRAASLPLFSDLAELAKLVACFAYFEDPAIQRLVRGDVQ